MKPCHKIPYASRSQAERTSKRILRLHRGGKPTRPYVCPRCGAWHITSRETIPSETIAKMSRAATQNRVDLGPCNPTDA